jgi:Ser/Thr protein kinase RdoA (MazF antagonist)
MPEAALDLSWERQVAPALAAYGLADRLIDARLLSLSENATYRCTFTGGDAPLVLRLHRPGFRTLAEIHSELMWIERLRADGAVTTPAVVRTAAGDLAACLPGPGGEARHAAVFEFAPGAEPEQSDFAAVMEVVGEQTAALHDHACRWSPPAHFTRPAWDLDGLLGASQAWGHWSANPDVREVPGGAELLARAQRKLTAELTAYGQGPDVFGLIHGDLRAANLLVAPDTVNLIDFDDCGTGWYLYDLACTLSFVEHDPRADQWVAAWLRGYERQRALSHADLGIIPAAVMLRRLMLVAWVHKRGETPFAAAIRPGFTAATAEVARNYLAGAYLAGIDRER